MFAGIHHVAVAVRKLEPALEFYRDLLGLHVSTKMHVPEQGVMAALLPLANGEIELLEPADPAGGVAKFVEKRGEGPHHFCVQTTDIAGAIEGAKAAGLPLIDQAPRKGLAGTIGFLHPRASLGVLVEMAQPGETPRHAVQTTNGIAAKVIRTLYIAVKDLETARDVYRRNFETTVESIGDDPYFKSKSLRLTISESAITLLDAGALDAQPPSARFLAGRCEGLMGIALEVADLDGAMRYLESSGIPINVRQGETGRMVRIDSGRTCGVNIYLA